MWLSMRQPSNRCKLKTSSGALRTSIMNKEPHTMTKRHEGYIFSHFVKILIEIFYLRPLKKTRSGLRINIVQATSVEQIFLSKHILHQMKPHFSYRLFALSCLYEKYCLKLWYSVMLADQFQTAILRTMYY